MTSLPKAFEQNRIEKQNLQKKLDEKSKLTHGNVDQDQSFDRKTGAAADKSNHNNQDGPVSSVLNSSNNQAPNLAQKEFTAKAQRLYFPKKEVESPRTTNQNANQNEDLKKDFELIAPEGEENFKREYKVANTGENQRKLKDLMQSLDLDGDDVGAIRICSTCVYQPKPSGPNRTTTEGQPESTDATQDKAKSGIKHKVESFMDRDETRDFHQKLLQMRKHRQPEGDAFTEENLNTHKNTQSDKE